MSKGIAFGIERAARKVKIEENSEATSVEEINDQSETKERKCKEREGEIKPENRIVSCEL